METKQSGRLFKIKNRRVWVGLRLGEKPTVHIFSRTLVDTKDVDAILINKPADTVINSTKAFNKKSLMVSSLNMSLESAYAIYQMMDQLFKENSTEVQKYLYETFQRPS